MYANITAVHINKSIIIRNNKLLQILQNEPDAYSVKHLYKIYSTAYASSTFPLVIDLCAYIYSS